MISGTFPAYVGLPGRILVVDDRPANLLAVADVLRPIGHTVVTANSGPEALRVLMEQDFAVILLDVNMPIMDGFEVAALIRQRESSSKTPIIFVTAHSAAEELVERGYALGAVDYIFSPVVPTMLRAKVEVFVELHNKRKQLEERGDMLELTLEGLLGRLELGIFKVDGSGQLKCMNEACARLLGVQFGRDPRPSVSAERAIPGFGACVEQARVAGGVLRRELELVRGRGTEWFALNLTVEQNGQVDGFIEDIGQRKRVELSLVRSNRDLEQFAYAASHDLRAPLKAIDDLSRWLEQDLAGQLSGDARTYLDVLRRRVERMTSMLDGLLQYSRVSDAEGAAFETIKIADVVRNSLELLAPRPGISVHVPNDLPTVVGARAPLQQVLLNLIGNAIKHNTKEQGEVRISARELPDFVEISVTDDGPGIDPRYFGKVFQMFQTLKRRDEVEGTGIGLALVKKLVEQQGGTVTLESAEGSGATFRFTWPNHWHQGTPLQNAQG